MDRRGPPSSVGRHERNSGRRVARASSIRPPTELGHFLQLKRLIEFAGLCGFAFCVGAGAALYAENSPFWTTQAIAKGENESQVVDRSRKGDRLQAETKDRWARPAETQDGFGGLEVAGPLSAAITIRDANGRLVFELDPLRRTTIISKRRAHGVPPSEEQSGRGAPKSRVVPADRPGECDPPTSPPVGSGILRLVGECYSRVPSQSKLQASLSSIQDRGGMETGRH
jgi:hypothetical protein